MALASEGEDAVDAPPPVEMPDYIKVGGEILTFYGVLLGFSVFATAFLVQARRQKSNPGLRALKPRITRAHMLLLACERPSFDSRPSRSLSASRGPIPSSSTRSGGAPWTGSSSSGRASR